MKLAVAIAGNQALDSAFVVWRGFEESIRKASEYGYHGVELALKNAEDVNARDILRWLEKCNMEVSCITTGQVFAALGLYFTSPDANIRKKAIEIFSDLIILAKDFGGLINIGRARGFVAAGQSRETAEKLFLETAEAICETADLHKVLILFEPVNRYEINFINSLDEGAELISKLKCNNAGLMPDIFHMNIEDDIIKNSLVRNASLLRYIHFADSNRLAPGWGHVDFKDVFDGLGEAGYDGWVSVEILPKPDPDSAARQAARFLLPKIERYNKINTRR